MARDCWLEQSKFMPLLFFEHATTWAHIANGLPGSILIRPSLGFLRGLPIIIIVKYDLNGLLDTRGAAKNWKLGWKSFLPTGRKLARHNFYES